MYVVKFTPGAQRDLAKVPPRDWQRIVHAASGLARDPRGRGTVNIGGVLYRLPVGRWRIIYSISDREREVVVVKVTRRAQGTYKRL